MERNSAISMPSTMQAAQSGPANRWQHGTRAANPPASREIFERLADTLPLPHSLSLKPAATQLRIGGYDNLAAHCLAVQHKPDRSINWAYRSCTEIIKHHSKSFYFSARLLPRSKRQGIMALYAFCRLSDDLVDEADGGEDRAIAQVKARLALARWAEMNGFPSTGNDHPVVVAWADTRNRYAIPQALADDLISGIRMDLSIDRYDTWDDLWIYCYRVASTVGLMSMYITGAESMEAVPYAVQLGVALQLTNILRDVADDARSGRIYLPADDMARFGYTEEMLMSGVANNQLKSLIEFEVLRAEALYEDAWQGIALLPPDSRMAVAAAATVYRGILGKIAAGGYDVFSGRAYLSGKEKLSKLPSVWWRSRRLRAGDIASSTVKSTG